MVAYGILPLFAFANSGVSLVGITLEALTHAVPAGIALGLVVGKTVGVFSAVLLTVKLGFARLPEGANWTQILGVSMLCGVGFTMSLFIAGLAFEGDNLRIATESRLGILAGSMVAGLVGYLILRFGSLLDSDDIK